MSDSDLAEFATLLDSSCMLMTRGTYAPNDTATGLFFRALKAYPMAAVRAAFEQHVCTSKFAPTPADLLGYLTAAAQDDGRPGAEEAWATALLAADEAATVVWTAEAATAWGVARLVFAQGDEVGARMAFKEVYTREVASARQAGTRPVWSPSLGHDPELRERALTAAVAAGRLSDGPALPGPRDPCALLLEGPQALGAPPEVMQRLKALRDKLAAGSDVGAGPDAEGKAATAGLRAAASAQAEAYAAARGINLNPAPESLPMPTFMEVEP